MKTDKTYRILFIGPPGSGKGTYSRYLSRHFGVPHISTGEMLREAVEAGDSLGEKVKGYLERGELVPDDIMIALFEKRIDMDDTKAGFMLDGFPRTIVQAKMLDKMFKSKGKDFDYIFNLWTPYNKIVRRALNRVQCEDCGKIYNLKNNPPKVAGVCDICGGKVSRRGDDTEETLWHRLKVYDEMTKPIIDFYSNRDNFFEIYTGGPVQEGLDEMMEIISSSKDDEA